MFSFGLPGYQAQTYMQTKQPYTQKLYITKNCIIPYLTYSPKALKVKSSDTDKGYRDG